MISILKPALEKSDADLAAIGDDPKARFRYLKELVDQSDILVSVHPSGLVVIKGEQKLALIVASKTAEHLRLSAINVGEEEEALAIKQTLGKKGMQ
jgi:hypothetical protein